MKLRLRKKGIRFDVHRLHDHQRSYTGLWLTWGLHRGFLKAEAGKSGSPFGYRVRYYHLGHPTVVGYATPYGRGTIQYLMSNEMAHLLRTTPPAAWEMETDSPMSLPRFNEGREVLKALRSGDISPLLPSLPLASSKRRLLNIRPIKD